MRVLRKLLSPLRHGPDDRAQNEFRPGDAASNKDSNDVARETITIDAREHLDAARYSESLSLIDRALEVAPRDPELLLVRASTLFGWGRFIEARNVLLEAEKVGLRTDEACVKLGWACFWIGRLDDALEWMRKAAAMRPDDWAAHFGVATVLRAQKHVAAGRASFERALELDPDSLHCISNLVACEIDLGRLDIGEQYARRAVDLAPRSAAVWSDLGMVLCEQGRFDEAIAAFERAQSFATTADASDDLVNFAICLLRAARTQQAIALLENRLPAYPSAAGHSQYALALLISGRLLEGFDQYEFRWIDAPLLAARPNFVKPVWTGQDLRGKTILLRAEQGFGDFIQFIRYVPYIKALGATVLLFVREELREVAEASEGVDRVLRANQPYPPFDFYANLLSIPRVFGTGVQSIPADVPYLRIGPDRTAKWVGKFAVEARLKVGLVWAGSPTHLRDRFRSLSLQQLAPLLGVDGVRMYSLQKGPASGELATLAASTTVVDLGAELDTFADTAAAISQLDLVIGVDTAVVHVAGALGKPVWTLVPTPADWRWLEDRDDSPWYPTMRLFRQREQGDWAEVIRRVTDALEGRVRAGNGIGSLAPAPGGALPLLRPVAEGVCLAVPGLSRVAETRWGIVQYFRDQPDVGEAIETYGEYLQSHLDLLASLVKPGMTAIEVGAGVGLHALALSRAIGPGGHLLVYEDDLRLRHVLKQNFAANDATNVTVMRRSLRQLGRVTGLDSSQDETIDDLRIERLDWLKINESADAPSVLRGAADTLWRLRPGIFIAVADLQPMDDVSLALKEFSYRCWSCRSPMFNPANFNRREHDVFAGRTSSSLLALPEESGASIAENQYVTACR